jgi:hypothetical protein
LSELKQITDAISAHQATLQAQAEAFQASVQEKFKSVVEAFFNEAPTVAAVTWTQYTPYFNDGEECVFSVNTLYFVREEDLFSEDEDESYADRYYGVHINFDASESEVKRYEGYLNQDRDSQYWQDAIDRLKKDMAIPESEREAMRRFNGLVSNNEDIMRAMFGDHVTVMITRANGIEVSDYDHD